MGEISLLFQETFLNSQQTLNRWRSIGLSGGGGTETPAISPHDPNLMLINCDMSGAYRTTDGGESWELLHWKQLTGCPFCAPCFHPTDPDTVFAAFSYDARLVISRDAGQTWTPHGSGLPEGLRFIAVDEIEPDRMVVATTTELYTSHDGGQTWALSAPLPGNSIGLVLERNEVGGTRYWYAAGTDGVLRSANFGASWETCTKGLPELPIKAFAGGARAGERRLYTWLGDNSGEGAIYQSADAAATWQFGAAMNCAGNLEFAYHRLLVSDLRPSTVYVVKPLFSAEDTVLRSDDAGSNWRPVAFADKTDPRCNMPLNYVSACFLPKSLWGWNTVAAAIDPNDPEHLLFNHYCSIFLTRDGGETWSSIESKGATDNPSFEAPIDQFRWINTGLTNTTTWNYYVDPFESNRHYIAYTDLGFARSEDSGETWIWGRLTGPNTYELAFDPEVPGRIWAAFAMVHDIPNNNIVLGGHYSKGVGCLGYSEDFGATWIGLNNGLPLSGASSNYDGSGLAGTATSVTSVILDPNSPADARTLYASLWEDGVYRSNDGGASWVRASNGLGAEEINERVCRLRLHPDGTLFCLVTGMLDSKLLRREGVGLYRSHDAGDNWEEITTGLDLRWLTDYEIDPRDSRIVYLGACDPPGNREQAGLYKTLDGGETWRLLTRKSSLHFGATLHPDNPDIVYMTLNYNDGKVPPLWRSDDAGESWTAYEDYPFCSSHRVHFDANDKENIYVTTYGSSVWKGPTAP